MMLKQYIKVVLTNKKWNLKEDCDLFIKLLLLATVAALLVNQDPNGTATNFLKNKVTLTLKGLL